ncbi:hypothetical protein [Enterocloster sp.]
MNQKTNREDFNEKGTQMVMVSSSNCNGGGICMVRCLTGSKTDR